MRLSLWLCDLCGFEATREDESLPVGWGVEILGEQARHWCLFCWPSRFGFGEAA